ncbi:MAG: hypothetical protein EBZ60_05700 [Betaproteobacteria bacterium]|nr:hypothetical protein [Betaproteobacteria bacterium]
MHFLPLQAHSMASMFSSARTRIKQLDMNGGLGSDLGYALPHGSSTDQANGLKSLVHRFGLCRTAWLIAED